MDNFPFQLFAWLANIFYSLQLIGLKLCSKYEIKNPWMLNFFYCGFVTILTIPLALNNNAGWPTLWVNLFFASFFWTLGNILYALVVYKIDVSTLSPLFNLRVVFTVILGTLWLHENLSVLQFIFIAIIFLGGTLVSLDENISFKKIQNKKYLFLVLLMLLCYSLHAVFIKKTILDNGYWTTILWVQIIEQILLLPTIYKFSKEIKSLSRFQYLFLLIFAVIELAGLLALNKAYEKNVSISATIVNIPLSALLVFLLSFIAPKLLEKHSLKVYALRLLGIILLLWAGIKLS